MSHMQTLSYREQVAAEVRAEIARQNRTMRGVAEDAGIPLATMSRKLRDGAPFDVEEIRRIAIILGVPMSSLMPNVTSLAVA